MEQNKNALHIFRRDLRLEDNTALNNALAQSNTVQCVFIFNPKQLDVQLNPYKTSNGLQFMLKSLSELQAQIEARGGTFIFALGEIEEVLPQIIKELDIDAIYLNKDYTPFAQKRDAQIQIICNENQIKLNACHDALLTAPESVHKDDGTPYTIYTPFYKRAILQEVAEPRTEQGQFAKNTLSNNYTTITDIQKEYLPKLNQNILVQGGREEALHFLNEATQLTNYKETRDIPSIRGTSLLSAHHKFGTVSIREVYWTMRQATGEDSQFIRELYWRDFATHICFYFPHVFGSAFKKQYTDLAWKNDEDKFTAWCEGKTGFPIIDAGMRELNTTGYMHNRVRMIVASFLTKDLHVDWQWGEKYFAQQLTDYDPCVNNTSWQWAASTGCDAQPYFRIFNPWLQQKRYDADCIYIKKWIPELGECDIKEIHNLETQRPIFPCDYPKPIVNHNDAKEYALALFKAR